MTRGQLSALARTIFDMVSAPLTLCRLDLSVRPSIGVATCPTDGTTADAPLDNAERAMLRACRNLVGYTYFDQRDRAS